MKIVLKVLFVIFTVWMIIGIYLTHQLHQKAQMVIGSGVLFLFFIFMPIFIYYRYKDGKYKKYIINDDKLRKAFNNVGKN